MNSNSRADVPGAPRGIKRVPAAPFTSEPPAEPVLWQLLGSEWRKKLKTYCDKGLWLSRLDQFGAYTREGATPAGTLGLLGMSISNWDDVSETVKADYANLATSTYAASFHASDDDPDEIMWQEKCGANGRTIAIRTSYAAIIEDLPHSGHGPFYVRPVIYVDHRDETDYSVGASNMLSPVFAVRTKYQRQNEVRVAIALPGLRDELHGRKGPYGLMVVTDANAGEKQSRYVGGYDGGKAIVIPIRPTKFISEILIGKALPTSASDEVRGMVKPFHIPCRLHQ